MGDYITSCTDTASPSSAAGWIVGRNEGSNLLRTSEIDR